MKNMVGNILDFSGVLLCGWAVVLLVWNGFLWVSSPPDDHATIILNQDNRMLLGGRRGQTIEIPIYLGETLGAYWSTKGIVMGLTSPGLDPIEAEIVASNELDWGEELRKFESLQPHLMVIYGEFTIPKTLPGSEQSTGAPEPSKPVDYTGTVSGSVTYWVGGDRSFTNSVVPLSYGVKLTVWPGQVPHRAWWKRWLGPSWRNFGVVAGIGLALILVAPPTRPEGEEWQRRGRRWDHF